MSHGVTGQLVCYSPVYALEWAKHAVWHSMFSQHGCLMHDGMDISAPWARSATEIARRQWRKILVIGAVDRGKIRRVLGSWTGQELNLK